MQKAMLREELNNNSIASVCKKHNLTFKELMKIITEPTYLKKKLPKHIYRKNTTYAIYHTVDGECVCFGQFRTLKEAKTVLKRLIESNWSLEPYEYLDTRYIVELKSGYRIQKTINGVQYSILTVKKLNDAILLRDLLVKFDWDLEYLPLILKQTGVKPNGS